MLYVFTVYTVYKKTYQDISFMNKD